MRVLGEMSGREWMLRVSGWGCDVAHSCSSIVPNSQIQISALLAPKHSTFFIYNIILNHYGLMNKYVTRIVIK